jgi:hypothetical protein
MKRPTMIAAAVTFALVPTTLAAQQPSARGQAAQPQQPGAVVVSYNKCAVDAVGRVDSTAALAFYPVLDELVREGRLLGWGVLTHAWGDEWNYIIYYTATNAAAFHSAYDEAIRRVRQRRPTFMTDFAPHCTDHKDNIYGVLRMGAPPPAAPAPR